MSLVPLLFSVVLLLFLFIFLIYTIVHNSHLHEANLLLPLTTVHAIISKLYYVDAGHSNILKVVFTTDDHKTKTFLVKDYEIHKPALHQDGMLTFQGTEFRDFV